MSRHRPPPEPLSSACQHVRPHGEIPRMADRHWKVLESRVTYQDRWLKLRTDRCETASGKILEGFHVVEFPDWINVVAIDEAQSVILAREYRHGAGRVVTGLPSGILEKTDVS